MFVEVLNTPLTPALSLVPKTWKMSQESFKTYVTRKMEFLDPYFPQSTLCHFFSEPPFSYLIY